MDISTLTPNEVAALSDADCTLDDAALRLRAVKGNTREEAEATVGQSFEECLKIKNTLDALEEETRSDPSWQRLSVIVNCEYRLYRRNLDVELRYNPFLSHWVEAVQRLQKKLGSGRCTKSISALGPGDIDTVRFETIRRLLEEKDSLTLGHASPKDLYERFAKAGQRGSFDVRKYIQMLEEEGIYEKDDSSTDEFGVQESDAVYRVKDQSANDTMQAQQHREKAKAKIANDATANGRQQWKQNMLSRLEAEPNTAIPELTHLPIELSSLDFLTTLLQDKTLQRFSIDPSPVIRDYLQHALRLAEQMGQPLPTATAGSSSTFSNGANGGEGEEADGIDHGRAAQVRAVKLLLLFIRNSIRKALLPPEALYFEIQEICVRYVWIREVREFRAFIEEGKVGE